METIAIANSKRRRGPLGIMAEMLEISKEGLLKTQIMYKANLSFTQLNEYLSFLLSIDLLTQTNREGKEVYVITEKGRDFLQRHAELVELLKSGNTHNARVLV